MVGNLPFHSVFYPTALKGIVFTHSVRMGGRAVVKGRLDQRSINRRRYGTIASRNRLNPTLPYVSQYPRVFYILSNFFNFPLINNEICHEFGFVYVYRHIYRK